MRGAPLLSVFARLSRGLKPKGALKNRFLVASSLGGCRGGAGAWRAQAAASSRDARSATQRLDIGGQFTTSFPETIRIQRGAAKAGRKGRRVKPDLFNSQGLIAWLEGVDPIWACLEFDSFCRLQSAPDAPDAAITLACDLTAADLAACPIASAALLMIEAAEAPGGLKLTANGNLRRAAVASLARPSDWPSSDLDRILSSGKRRNEEDVWPLRFLRILLTDLRLVRKQGAALVPTGAGLAVLKKRGAGDLVARLFEETFWRFNLSYFDGFPLEGWPQSEMGLILWCLATGANLWERPGRLARLAAVPAMGVLQAEQDFAGGAFEMRVLRFLTFFGVMETRPDCAQGAPSWFARRQYRKAPFCDRFLSFDVDVEAPDGSIH
jgi:hypothetical protein